MKTTLFSKAIKLQENLTIQGTTSNTTYYEFDFKDKPVLVSIRIEDNTTIIKCSCTHSSLHPEALCSYRLACCFYEFKQEMRRFRKKW